MTDRNNTPQISLVATCKGRLANLRKCLPTWLDLEGADYEIVIVDYDCPDGVGDYVQSHRAGWLRDCRVSNIKVVRVDNKPYFNLNDARNRGLKAADAPIVMMIDSDISISRTDLLPWLLQRFATGVEFVGNLAVLPAQYVESHMFYRWKYAVDVEAPLLLPMVAEHLGLTGTACFRAKAAEDCGGYDPVINQSGYGSDDIEFYLRYLNRPCHGAGQPPQTTFEEGLSRVGYFPERALETEDNDEEVKQRFYT
jgi:glycosyltransferase involved in cell wall biosynthesis